MKNQPEKQAEIQAVNVAVAKLCGWEFIPSHDSQGKAVPERWTKDGFEYFNDAPFPNYHSDANTRAEMLAVMNPDQRIKLLTELGSDPSQHLGIGNLMDLLRLDQPTFAKAFLKVMKICIEE